MVINMHLVLVLSISGVIACSAENLLYGVFRGSFYVRAPPYQNSKDEWLATARKIGTGITDDVHWGSFMHLFFHPDGTLYGVLNRAKDLRGRLYKGPPPKDGILPYIWMDMASDVGGNDWNLFQFLFFDPQGILYGVRDGKLYKRSLPIHSNDPWYKSAVVLESDGWDEFDFLFFDPMGMLYAVRRGNFYKGHPPKAADDTWLASSTLIGIGGCSDFKFLFFMPSGELYGVYNGNFYKGSPPADARVDWVAKAEKIGSGGWDEFDYLICPL